MIVALLIGTLALLSLGYALVIVRAAIRQKALVPKGEAVALGAVLNFFDTLGIGSFAPTMAWFRLRRLVPDKLIPATRVAGHTLPTIAQSAIFLILLGVKVDAALLVGCIAGMLVGGYLGVSLVGRLPLRAVQGTVGVALLLAALMYALSNLDLMPAGGDAVGLASPWFWVAIGAHVLMGVLANFGVGNYAPTLILLSLMGMDPRLAFPIMASSAAFALLLVGGKNIAADKVDMRIVIGITLGGIPAVLVAALIVKQMPIEPLRWMVVVVVIYAAVMMLRSAFSRRSNSPDLA